MTERVRRKAQDQKSDARKSGDVPVGPASPDKVGITDLHCDFAGDTFATGRTRRGDLPLRIDPIELTG
jgi:hypothetical protein